jgi:DNA repair photolyase
LSIVSFTEQVHDRVSLEVLRGCTQSCRFCQAGMTTRPVRERTLDERAVGEVCADDSRLGLEQDRPAVGHVHRPAPSR